MSGQRYRRKTGKDTIGERDTAGIRKNGALGYKTKLGAVNTGSVIVYSCRYGARKEKITVRLLGSIFDSQRSWSGAETNAEIFSVCR